ncbi:PIN domain-containing protein [Flavobacterium sp.]|uniref:PIN domain-containing protein n=1 Tax=Flavobacterium sp. TaxID=239 RepID=UPI00260D6911|nr:PIN domain-containing protein [Flavobacterium sp.]
MAINLILDTQTWIYLANGFNQSSSKYEDGQHFKLYQKIEDFRKKKQIKLIVNEVVVEEWNRNKKSTLHLIEKHTKTMEGNANAVKNMKQYLSEDGKSQLDETFLEYKNGISQEIEKNKIHIAKIEKLMFKDSLHIPVSDQIRIDVTMLAQKKKAPFHNKNNSVNDALILFSIIDYLKNCNADEIGTGSIFISNNSDDYCEKIGSKIIHPDLSPYFLDADLEFETNIGKALDLSPEIIEEIDNYRSFIGRYSDCLSPSCPDEDQMNAVEYAIEEKIRIAGKDVVEFNPYQLQLKLGKDNALTRAKVDLINWGSFAHISFGNCEHCNALHLRCECGSEHLIGDSESFIVFCYCGAAIEKKNDILEFTEFDEDYEDY